MSPYTPNDAFTGPEIYDLSDLVKGGDSGDANVPLKAIYDQTNYVKNRLGRYEDVKVITDDYPFDVSDLRKLLVFQIGANKAFTLPSAGSLPAGTRICVATVISGIKALTVQGAHPIRDGVISWVKWNDNTAPAIYMHDGEFLSLVAATDHWIVEEARGNFYTAGESFAARRQFKNTIVANGITYNRSDVPRIALMALALGGGIVPDAVWLGSADPSPLFRGCYSLGDGSNTIRVPDERGMSEKYLDLGRGLDSNRGYNASGGFEEEMVGRHDQPMHGSGSIAGGGGPFFLTNKTGSYSGAGQNSFGGRLTIDTDLRTGFNIGTANIVKNIGKIPLIPY